MRTILFAFWGRKTCVERQLPFVRRILEENPDATFEGWNLARNPVDAEYLRSLSDEFCIREDFYQHHDGWNAVWKHYAAQPSDAVYIKFDDDIAFIETDRIGEFAQAVRDHPGEIISAQVVNNGASLPTFPELYAEFSRLNIPLLDVHLSNRFAEMSHAWFFEHWAELVGQPVETVPEETWCSINFIGMDHQALSHIAKWVGQPSPAQIADRLWGPGSVCGDEGAANLLPRKIVKGMVVGHVSFGPQELTPTQWGEWLTLYESIGSRYLEGR